MRVIKQPQQLTKLTRALRCGGKTIGFVPTMGALHEGHMSLVRAARRGNDIVVVSIFVNPAQFGPDEDFKRYPRPLKNDLELCRREGVDFVFTPGVEAMYPARSRTFIEVAGLSGVLCGASRPGHFRGVATVVAKLFNIVGPDRAYFGSKDAQQARVILRMVEDLNIPVRIVVIPIVREPEGLAMSSRNRYLSPAERKDAAVLYESLRLARSLFAQGERSAAVVTGRMRRMIAGKHTARIDYLAAVDPETLEPVKVLKGECLIALAVWIGKTRLIDNIRIDAGKGVRS